MNRKWSVLAATGAVCLLFGGAYGVDIVVDGNSEHQTMDGFGTSVMNWMSTVFGNAQLRTDYARDLGCSIVRGELHPAAITKGCMNLNPTVFGADIDANAALMDFVNQSRVSITGGFAKAVYEQRLDEMKVMLSIWTPPDWMKTNTNYGDPGCQSYGGHLTRTHENRTNFARYVAAWIKGFSETYQIPIYNLSVQNELDWAHSPTSWTTSCQYFSKTFPTGATRTLNGPPLGTNDYNPAVEYIYNELQANNIPMKFFGPEKSHIFSNENELGVQLSYISDMETEGTMEIMDGFCHHGYALAPGNRQIVSQYRNAVAKYDKPSWQTEAGHHPISWDGAMQLARCIQDEIVAGDLSAYINWNYASDAADDEYGLVISMNQRTDKYFAFKHFSRYIRPGAVRLACTPDDPNGLSVSAFRHRTNGTLTIVMINCGGAQTATITIPAEPEDLTSFSVFTTQSGSPWVESSATMSGNSVSVFVPASSFITLYGEGRVDVRKQEEIAPAHRDAPARPTVCRRLTGNGVRIVSQPLIDAVYREYDLRGRMTAVTGKIVSERNIPVDMP